MAAFLGIDVGTGSVRAGLFDDGGTLLGYGTAPIRTRNPRPGMAQQSSKDIWSAVAVATRTARKTAGIAADAVAGIGFDATCSLVVAGKDGRPVSVDPEGAGDEDVVLWMDHRAITDADEINAIGGAPLAHVGGRVSPEMQMPKLRWLKRELPAAWSAAERFWDLPDWLVHRATGTETRSLCSAVCKWTYLGHQGVRGEGWDDTFLAAIGLADLSRDNHAAIGRTFAAPGAMAGALTDRAATELDLSPGLPVSTSLIDAHAGALGTLGLGQPADLAGKLAVIAGTSACHIVLTEAAKFVPGVWGPYFEAVLPGLWALEGGQSAAGALMDAMIARHAATGLIDLAPGTRPATAIEAHLSRLAGETAVLTRNRHVQPDFHGNRSPLAEPTRRGAISGLTLDTGLDDLALDYLATIQALAYGTRHIIEEMEAAGVAIRTIVMSGGLSRNGLYLREHADATGRPVLVPKNNEPVLVGSAMLGAVAAGRFGDLREAAAAMSGGCETVQPRGGEIAAFHDRKYRVMRRMQDDFAVYTSIMKD